MIIAVGTDEKSSITMNERSKSHHNPPSSSSRADYFFREAEKILIFFSCRIIMQFLRPQNSSYEAFFAYAANNSTFNNIKQNT